MRSVAVFLLMFLMSQATETNPAEVNIQVNANQAAYTMLGGIGASWHAMSYDAPLEAEKYDYPVRSATPRGSGYGGNPSVSNRRVWDELGRHARWLGLDWLRVEVSLRMWEPEKGKYQWDGEEMQALYRILDWCEANKADVFLQNMWSHVEWNAYPGVHPILSAPRDLEAFAEGLAALVDHLTRDRGYTCLTWFCITNEPPGGTWGYWWSTGSYPSITITPALAAVRKAFDRRRLSLPLSAPDWTDLPPFDPARLDFDPFIGAYDIHSYQGIDQRGQETLGQWANWAHGRGKPFFLSEMGNMQLGWGGDNPGPRSFAASLSMAEGIARGVAVGVDAFNRWSYTNRGDLDGQWQLVQTWDRQQKRYLEQVIPEPAAYFGYGIITRLIPKHSIVLKISKRAPAAFDPEKTLAAAWRWPNGEMTLLLVNRAPKAVPVSVEITGCEQAKKLFRYQVTEAGVIQPGFTLRPDSQIDVTGNRAGFSENLPSQSITVYSTRRLEPEDPGVIAVD